MLSCVFRFFFTGRHSSESSPKAGCLCSYKKLYKEELKTVVHKLLACTQTIRHETFTALWNPYRRVSSRGRRAQIRFSRGARSEKPENEPSTSCTGVCLAITMLQYYICLGIVLTVILVLGLGLGFGIILYFVIGTWSNGRKRPSAILVLRRKYTDFRFHQHRNNTTLYTTRGNVLNGAHSSESSPKSIAIVYTVCALIFAGFIFREFAIFAFFAFLTSRLLGAVVLKYSRIYRLSPYTIIVYGSCRGAK